MSPLAFIIVHGGAGVHGYKVEQAIKSALRNACVRALNSSSLRTPTHEIQQEHTPSLQMVQTAIQHLEDDEHLNAGYGSNLTLEGTVECDAAIMHGTSGLFGSVGAVSGVQNPILAARAVLEQSSKKDGIGRVPPLTLVSSGAHNFASTRGVRTIPPESLIAPPAKDRWEKWMKRLEHPSESTVRIDEEREGGEGLADLQDTVGAVAFCEADGVAAGVSSGGLLLKYPGRVGEAAVYGAGCWAASSRDLRQGVACSVSGTGEHIVRLGLARRIGEALAVRSTLSSSEEDSEDGDDRDPHGVLEGLMKEFWELGKGEDEWTPSAGTIVLTVEEGEDGGESRVRLWCAFTTASMAVAYASTRHPKPKAMIIRRLHPRSGNEQKNGDKPQVFITSILL